MRIAFQYKPGSKEAREIGCICKNGKMDAQCPIHFPIRYIKRINDIEQYIKTSTKVIIVLVSILIILQLKG